jgi:hypothetical protein
MNRKPEIRARSCYRTRRNNRLPVPKAAIVAAVLVFCCAGAAARTWHVEVDGSGDVPTIQAAADSASPGDEILVGPGRYTWANQGGGTNLAMITFYRSHKGFTMRSEAGAAATILDAQRQNRVIFIQGYNNITLDGFTITGGDAPADGYHIGGGVCAHVSTDDVIRNCVFVDNRAQWAGGLWSGGWNNLLVENCEFRNNYAGLYGGGLGVGSSEMTTVVRGCVVTNNTAGLNGGGVWVNRAMLRLENSVVARNTASAGGGLYANRAWSCEVTGCTFARNDAPVCGGIYAAWTSVVSVSGTIVAYGREGGALAADTAAVADISCCNIFGNGGGDEIPLRWVDGGGNFSADPRFCDRQNLDFTLYGDSPCLPGAHPGGTDCGLIGALGPDCGVVPTAPSSWGSIKAKLGI